MYTYYPSARPQADVSVVFKTCVGLFTSGPLWCLQLGLPREPRQLSQPAKPTKAAKAAAQFAWLFKAYRLQQIDRSPFSCHSICLFAYVHISAMGSTSCLENKAPAGDWLSPTMLSVRIPKIYQAKRGMPRSEATRVVTANCTQQSNNCTQHRLRTAHRTLQKLDMTITENCAHNTN